MSAFCLEPLNLIMIVLFWQWFWQVLRECFTIAKHNKHSQKETYRNKYVIIPFQRLRRYTYWFRHKRILLCKILTVRFTLRIVLNINERILFLLPLGLNFSCTIFAISVQIKWKDLEKVQNFLCSFLLLSSCLSGYCLMIARLYRYSSHFPPQC